MNDYSAANLDKGFPSLEQMFNDLQKRERASAYTMQKLFSAGLSEEKIGEAERDGGLVFPIQNFYQNKHHHSQVQIVVLQIHKQGSKFY